MRVKSTLGKITLNGFLCSSFLALSCATFAQDLGEGVAVGADKQDSLPARKKMRIEIPKEYRGHGRKLRIRNLTTGKETIVDLSDEEFISSDVARSLLDKNSDRLEPQFSILDRRGPADQKQFTETQILGQPYWRPLKFRKIDQKGQLTLELESPNSSPKASEAERRRPLREDRGIKRLFEIGWKALRVKRPDLAEQAFSRILTKQKFLNDEQKAQAHLGHGIALFHQKGCAASDEDLVQADQDPRNHDDVSYFRALCMVEDKKYDEARVQFQELVGKQHPTYAEPSRFYLGVVAENEKHFDDAKSAYLDTIDFANDPRLVALAKERLAALKAREMAEANKSGIFSGALTAGAGYDSNVVALPRGVDPSEFSVSKESSASMLAVLLTELQIANRQSFDANFRYLFSAFHYTESSVSQLYDLQSHELGLAADMRLSPRWELGTDLSYNAVFLGPISSAGEYLATPALQFKLNKLLGDAKAPRARLENSFALSWPRPKRAATSPELDLTANDYLVSSRYKVKHGTQTLGSGLELEYHPSAGIMNSFYAFNLIGSWDLPLGKPAWDLFVNQEAKAGGAVYWASTENRKDMSLTYTASLARSWKRWLETRLQFTGTLAFSSVKDKYQYQRAQINLLVTALF
jgi:TolA-binding protein